MDKKFEAFEAMETFSRPRWKNGVRIFGFIVMLALNVSLIMSDVERAGKHRELSFLHELITYLCLLLIDATLLLPIVFEVDLAIVQDSTLTLKTLFWTAKLPWADVVSYKNLNMMKFAILKTKKCFYLLNKRDIRGYDRVAQTISQRIEANNAQVKLRSQDTASADDPQR